MKRIRLVLVMLAAAMVITTAGAYACTGVYVGKKVSTDGTTIIARSEDQGESGYNKLFKVMPRITKAGRYMVDTGEDQNGFRVPLPETTYKYTYVPDSTASTAGMFPACCTNEYGVAVMGTVSAGHNSTYDLFDPYVDTGTGLREAIEPALIDCQCKTAREAVVVFGKLLKKYGSEEGSILMFADKKEAWIFEVYGGHQYCAMRMPEDKVAAFGNQFMIGGIDYSHSDDYYMSPGLINVLNSCQPVMKDGMINIAMTISNDYDRSDYSNMRTWMGHKILAASTAGDYDSKTYYPLFYKPDSKVSVLDVMDIYRNRFQGTKYDMSKSKNAALRAIGANTQSDIHIVQVFSDMPKDCCDVMWLCLGNAEHSVFVPYFSGITSTYKAYHVKGAQYDYRSAYWSFKQLDEVGEADNRALSQTVKDYWKIQELGEENTILSQMPLIKKAYTHGTSNGRAYVTALGKKMGAEQFGNAHSLYSAIVTNQIMNQTDKSEDFYPETLQVMVKLKGAAKMLGYKVEVSGGSYTLTKGDVSYSLETGVGTYTITKGMNVSTDVFGKKPYASSDNDIYVPLEFVKSLE